MGRIIGSETLELGPKIRLIPGRIAHLQEMLHLRITVKRYEQRKVLRVPRVETQTFAEQNGRLHGCSYRFSESQ
jgi:hypothetical protein